MLQGWMGVMLQGVCVCVMLRGGGGGGCFRGVCVILQGWVGVMLQGVCDVTGVDGCDVTG